MIPRGGIRTKGDANSEPDVFVATPSNVIGEVVGHIDNGGYVLVYFSQWTGVLSLMVVALTIWLAWSICFPSAVPTVTSVEKKPLVVVPKQRSGGTLVGATRSRTWSVRRSRDTADEDERQDVHL